MLYIQLQSVVSLTASLSVMLLHCTNCPALFEISALWRTGIYPCARHCSQIFLRVGMSKMLMLQAIGCVFLLRVMLCLMMEVADCAHLKLFCRSAQVCEE